ncbi:c-type cytochrome [Methylocystis echinoides]|nr:c-type cytochrome [Methylocystis echinoides]
MTAAGALGAAGLAAIMIMAGGIYDIGASKPHFAVTYWLLDFAKRRSIETQSFMIRAPRLDDPDMITLGAAHYLGGCRQCHGAPGAPRNPIASSMLPQPADLVRVAPTWTSPQLFWIVRNGLKYTGMPAWPDVTREDEVWALVAFLRALPTMSREQYARLSAGGLAPPQRSGREIAEFGAEAEALSRCGRCHDPPAPGAASALVPRLAGQSRAYLELALRDYAEGRRASGVMRPVVAELDNESIAILARYYGELPPMRGAAMPEDAGVKRGRTIAERGDLETGAPPCLACHGATSAATFPRLDGQSARYLESQLRFLKAGQRMGSIQSKIMTVIAARLSDEQIDSVTRYFASVQPPAKPAPSAHHAKGR